MNKLYGLMRDLNYYLFKAGGWKWVLFAFVLLNIARCGFQIHTTPLAPNCALHSVEVNENGVTAITQCEQSKEGKEFLCQLLREVSIKRDQKSLVLEPNQLLAGPAEDLEKLIMAASKSQPKVFLDYMNSAGIVKD